MKLNKLLLILFFSIKFIGVSYAGGTFYECTIKDSYNLNNETGKIELTSESWNEIFKGKKFNVSRLSGDIVGSTLLNHDAKQIVVINKGSKEYNFKTISIFDHPNGEKEWQILTVQEITNSQEKPFIAFSVAGIITGICK
jgi:hypothetical protein